MDIQENGATSQSQPNANPIVTRNKRIFRNALIGTGIAGIVVSVLILVLFLLYPAETNLFFNALGSVFNSPSQSKTFLAPGVTFAYPANWVSINTTQFASVIASKRNSSSSNGFGNKSQIAIVVPASEVLSLVDTGPTLLSEYLASPRNFTLPNNISFIAAGAITVLNREFSPSNSILKAVPNAYLRNITLGGYNGVNVQFYNTKVLNVSLVFAELSVAEQNGSVCFVFGAAGSQDQVYTVNQSFNRAAQTIQCSFTDIGTSVPASILDEFLSLLG